MLIIKELDDYRPHLMVVASDGVHLIPQALIENIIAGRKESMLLTEPVIRRVLEEWLEKVIQ
ncbi:hypothetical protein [Pseudomonas massiliensis]|uniref:hypothetical protein n=1 Tax=Pseudomonas massiliensis TaxID=522492 RepID=UPI00058B1318|nr:hypothetical protein [Pseudomonas massiliensis]